MAQSGSREREISHSGRARLAQVCGRPTARHTPGPDSIPRTVNKTDKALRSNRNKLASLLSSGVNSVVCHMKNMRASLARLRPGSALMGKALVGSASPRLVLLTHSLAPDSRDHFPNEMLAPAPAWPLLSEEFSNTLAAYLLRDFM